MADINEKPLTRDYLEVILGRLENKIDARFNALEAKINNQRTLLIVAILAIVAQIINAWVLHKF